ncbi:GNAT family N-acetyltransferase [Planococcus shixiaomingii]|uniref:GNAT family N-acetyltransferase n=1 Tax=Planococcus shixiaomingii TaxID=3058393 RepID=UPI002630EBE2|nr:GNAT family N-acetyltransferase [Planococcus sp. N022]WKA54996.1 GNAT family N-acetyltransferase [Planococcus sp. N022]
MNAEILSYREKPIPGSKLKALYENAGWWPQRSAQDLEDMLKSEISMGVWQEDRLIGFARVVTDGKFRAYIVHNEFRKNGIGTQLVEKLMDELARIDVVSLFCGEELLSFYGKQGFKHSKAQFVMHRK